MLYFVYGTLKKGFPNHKILENETFLGNGVTEGRIYESHLTGIPFFVPYNVKNIGKFGKFDFKKDIEQVFTQKRKAPEIATVQSWLAYGEIYDVYHQDTWRNLDILEDYSEDKECNLYERVLYPVFYEGKHEWAWIYALFHYDEDRNPTDSFAPGMMAKLVKSGRYTNMKTDMEKYLE